MNRKIRLGPIAVFLAVVAVVLATLVTLTTATTTADMLMAKRFAQVTQTRYALEAEGERFLKSCDGQARSGKISAKKLAADMTTGKDAGAAKVTKEKSGYSALIEKDGYTLEINITEPNNNGRYNITKWKITKDWNADDPYKNIWKGGQP